MSHAPGSFAAAGLDVVIPMTVTAALSLHARDSCPPARGETEEQKNGARFLRTPLFGSLDPPLDRITDSYCTLTGTLVSTSFCEFASQQDRFGDLAHRLALLHALFLQHAKCFGFRAAQRFDENPFGLLNEFPIIERLL